MKKRMLVLALGMALSLAVAGCGNKTAETKEGAAKSEAVTTNEDGEVVDTEEVDEDGEDASGDTEEGESGELTEEEIEEIEEAEEEVDEEDEQTPEEEVMEEAYTEEFDGADAAAIEEYIDGLTLDVCGLNRGKGIEIAGDLEDEDFDRYNYSFYFDGDEHTIEIENYTDADPLEGTYKVEGSSIKFNDGKGDYTISIEKGIASVDYDGAKLYLY